MPPKATRSQRVKREAISQANGLITPKTSMSSSITGDNSFVAANTKEEINIKRSFTPAVHDGSSTIDRPPPIDLEQDEGYSTQAVNEADLKRGRRSESPSLASLSFSRHPTVQPPRQSMAPSIASRMPAPGASLELVGEKVSLLVNAIEELRKLGLKEIDTELPELVLVGDQSAGKSSLMGAIAEINLPKDKGMCTRCPANIKTTSADNWSCTISLHESYRYSATPRRIPSKKNPFPPWVDNDGLAVKHFKTIFQKHELEDCLRWAQVALLNPSQDYRSFIPGTGALAREGLSENFKHEADFSPNIVAIEIAGPRLPALSFYDLPGIFQSAANKDEEYLIGVFENLARMFIKHPKALIICARTMANDPGNCRTITLIREENAQKRTIGVLTMPDRLPEGSIHHDFDKILRKEAHVLPRGYFVTKQPGPLFTLHGNDYHVQAREEEDLFFNTDSRWTGEWGPFRDRCGTGAIQSYLSQEFARLIVGSMPSIEAKINARVQFVDEQLSHLPDLPQENVQHIVRQCLQDFSSGVQNLLDRGSSHSTHAFSYSHSEKNFLSSWSELSVDFADAIQKMKPMFTIVDPSDTAMPEVINLDSDDDSSTISSLTNSTRKHAAPLGFSTPPSKLLKIANGAVATPGSSQVRPKDEEGTPTGAGRPLARRKPGVKKTVFDEYAHAGKHFMRISDVREIISRHRRPGHPDNVPDAAREEICVLTTSLWRQPMDKLRDVTFVTLRRAVDRELEVTLRKYRQTDLYRESKRHAHEFLDRYQEEERESLEKIYDLESYKLFTLNNEVFLRYKAEELEILRAARRKHRVRCHVKKRAHLNKKTLNEKDRETQEKTITDEQLGLDPFSLEIDTAAYVRGYYKTAANRFSDNVCLNILGTLFRKVQANIPQMLESALGLNIGDGELKCRALMNEDLSGARERAALQEERAKLKQAALRLEKLVTDFGFEALDEDNDVDMYDDNYEEDDQEDTTQDRRSMSMSLADRGRQPRVESAPPSP